MLHRRLSLPIPWILLILLTLSSLSAGAATFTVTKTVDTHDGSCTAADCSLREAVTAAAAGDTINFASSLNGQTIILYGIITLDKSLTLQGPGASQLTISGDNNADGVGDTGIFQTSGNNLTITIDGLTLEYGIGVGGVCGAIYNRNTLTLSNSTLRHNQGNVGGAICNEGTLTVSNST